MKPKRKGITLIEILLVVSIIVVLAGLLIPAMTMVRKMANETKQRAELTTIELAILAFKNDYGDYPPSDYRTDYEDARDYSGAQKLAEALCGWDLLGFEPNSVFRSDGYLKTPSVAIYSQNFNTPPTSTELESLKTRKGPYLDMTKVSVFKIDDLFNGTGLIAANTYVLCDAFGVKNVQKSGKNVRAGAPILYYRANTNSKDHSGSGTPYDDRIYNALDNDELIQLRTLTPSGALGDNHPIGTTAPYNEFYEFIEDKDAPIPWPYRPDSYLLITAGADGRYGTKDDICNFPVQ